jgi:hypothetical protein
MSRRVNGPEGMPTEVTTDEWNRPLTVEGEPVLRRLAYFREWIGILDGEPQLDVWRVETPSGICELHFRSYPNGEEEKNALDPACVWILARWED